MVVAGDSGWLSDMVTTRSAPNLALGLNLTDWLAQQDTLAAIRSKIVSSRQLEFSSATHQNLVQYINILGIPITFIIIGFTMAMKRRRESMKVYRIEE